MVSRQINYSKMHSTVTKLYFSCCLAMILSVYGCSSQDSVQPIKSDAERMIAMIEVNHKAILLSTHHPYDTVQLSAIPRNIYGDTLPLEISLQFKLVDNSDNIVELDSSGFIRALGAISKLGVEVSTVVDGFKFSDTAFITVRAETPVRKIANVQSFYRTDSNWVWMDQANNWNTVGNFDVIDEDSRVVPRSQYVIGYKAARTQSLAGERYTINDYELMGDPRWVRPGKNVIHARLYAYGKHHQDSFVLYRVKPSAAFIMIGRVSPRDGEEYPVVYPENTVLPVGSTVIFLNGAPEPENAIASNGGYRDPVNFDGFPRIKNREFSASYLQWVDSVDIVFDNLIGIGRGDSLMRPFGRLGAWFSGSVAQRYPSLGGSGNIALFSKTICYRNLDYNPGEDITCGGLNNGAPAVRTEIDPGYRSRRFDCPGVYTFRSTLYPSIVGRITITELDRDDPRFDRRVTPNCN